MFFEIVFITILNYDLGFAFEVQLIVHDLFRHFLSAYNGIKHLTNVESKTALNLRCYKIDLKFNSKGKQPII